MTSQNYQIQGGNFNMTSGNKSSANFKLSDVVGQTAAGQFSSKGYFVQAGFLNEALGVPLLFSVVPAIVDFGSLSPNNPLEKTLQISIDNGNTPGYTVKVTENQPLSTSAGADIADTSCDSDTSACTYSQASVWKGAVSYGFGYRMTGITVPADFSNPTAYRPFAATKRGDTPVIIMETKARKVKDTAVMTVKVNIGPNQPVGQYRNVLSFIALSGI